MATIFVIVIQSVKFTMFSWLDMITWNSVEEDITFKFKSKELKLEPADTVLAHFSMQRDDRQRFSQTAYVCYLMSAKRSSTDRNLVKYSLQV